MYMRQYISHRLIYMLKYLTDFKWSPIYIRLMIRKLLSGTKSVYLKVYINHSLCYIKHSYIFMKIDNIF